MYSDSCNAPDLTASVVTPTTATEDAATSFSATVSNIGTASSGAGFTTLFQRANDASGTGVIGMGTHARTTELPASGTFVASASYTFPNTGTWYVRACADKVNAADTDGVIDEPAASPNGEFNNCGAWVAVTVSIASIPVPVATITNNGPVPAGTTAVLTYSCTNSTSATLTGFGSVTPVSGGTRTTPVLSANENYQLTCTGAGGTDNDTTTVIVQTPTIDISAEPSRVNSGGSVDVTWVSELCTAVSVTKNGAAFPSALQGTDVDSGLITAQTVFRATCNGGVSQDDVIVNIVPKFEEF